MKKSVFCAVLISGCLLMGCNESSSVPQEMQYIKTSVFYDTVMDMYNNPDNYLGGKYHMVGELTSVTDDSGATYYSVCGNSPTDRDERIGIELKYDDFSNVSVGDTITVEGTLDTEKAEVEGEEHELLILRVTLLEKRA